MSLVLYGRYRLRFTVRFRGLSQSMWVEVGIKLFSLVERGEGKKEQKKIHKVE